MKKNHQEIKKTTKNEFREILKDFLIETTKEIRKSREEMRVKYPSLYSLDKLKTYDEKMFLDNNISPVGAWNLAIEKVRKLILGDKLKHVKTFKRVPIKKYIKDLLKAGYPLEEIEGEVQALRECEDITLKEFFKEAHKIQKKYNTDKHSRKLIDSALEYFEKHGIIK